MKYDCNKTLDFLHEAKRMCESSEDSCNGCQLRHNHWCIFDNLPCKVYKITQEKIDWLQKWSDKHPEETYKSVLLEALPNCNVDEIARTMCPKRFFEKSFDCDCASWCEADEQCWNKVYEIGSNEDKGNDQ